MDDIDDAYEELKDSRLNLDEKDNLLLDTFITYLEHTLIGTEPGSLGKLKNAMFDRTIGIFILLFHIALTT